jgi:sialic acid synthase SpsE
MATPTVTRSGVTIVAEAAQGFEGDPFVSRLLVRAAAAGRADMVKFQLVYADELATTDYPYHALFKGLEMPPAAWEAVAAEARRLGLGLVFDVFGHRALGLARGLGAAAVKIHSTDFFNEPLVEAALADVPQVFFSVGGIEPDEIARFLERRGAAALTRLTMLFGFQSEPTATADNNLRRLAGFRERFPHLRLGFMDHADGESDEAGWLGVLALPFGVSAIEKHITLDRGLRMEDHVSALASTEFAAYVDRIRVAEVALGHGDLALSPVELAYRGRALKIVVAARALHAGEALRVSDVVLLRAPFDTTLHTVTQPAEVAGRKLLRDVPPAGPVYREDLA